MKNIALKVTKALVLLFYSQSLLAIKDQSENPDVFQLSLEELLQIKVTTAAKSEQPIAEAPSIISVITANELEKLAVNTLGEALNLSPGVSLIEQQKGDQILVIRGLALNDGVLVLIDGAPVNDAFDGSGLFYNRSIEDIHRIEILRGPSSALYGSYAVSGVIHIFTKRWEDRQEELKLQISSGNFSAKSFAINYAPVLYLLPEELKISTSFSYSDERGDSFFIQQDSIFTPGQGTFLPPFSNPTLTPTEREKPLELFNGHLAMDYKNLGLTYVHSQELTHPIISHSGIVTERLKSIKETTQDLLSVNFQHTTDTQISYFANLYYTLNESKLFGQSEPPQIHGDEDQDGLNENFFSGIIENFHHQTESLGFDLHFKYTIGESHDLLFGLNQNRTKLVKASKFANVSLAGRGPTEIFPIQDLSHEFITQNIERKEKALYAQDNWQFNDSVNITLGIRFGDYNDFGSTSDPRVGINFRLTPKLYSKFLYGEAFKAPAFDQLFDATPTLSANRQRGNIDLSATEIETIEWQVGYDFSSILKGNATLFHNETENEIFFDPTPGIEQWQNSGERTSKGIELELKGELLGFDLSTMNYSYQRTSGVQMGAGADIHSPHRFNFSGTKTFSDSLNWSLALSYYSSPQREVNDQRSRIDARTILNTSVKWSHIFVNDLSLELSVKNLLDDEGRFETQEALGLLDDLPIEGRRINLSLEYRLP